MLSVIKTAIITITISFISGVLLDHYKNVAPRIVCHIGRCVPVKIRSKRIKAYVLTVRNISKKTIHNLNLNVQSRCTSFTVEDAKITNGLKFDISSADNTYDVSIPFLSKNDEFSVKIFLQDFHGVKDKPIIALRSPENFKRIDSGDDSWFINMVRSIQKNISDFFSKRNFYTNKKIIITIASVILLICIGILTSGYYRSNKSLGSPDEKTNNLNKTENVDSSAGKSNTNAGPNEKSKTPVKNNSTSKEEPSRSETNSSVSNSSNASQNKNTKTLIDENEDTENDKNEGSDKKNQENENSHLNNKNNENTKQTSESNSDKNSDSKSNSKETNKSISQDSNSSNNGTSSLNKH